MSNIKKAAMDLLRTESRCQTTINIKCAVLKEAMSTTTVAEFEIKWPIEYRPPVEKHYRGLIGGDVLKKNRQPTWNANVGHFKWRMKTYCCDYVGQTCASKGKDYREQQQVKANVDVGLTLVNGDVVGPICVIERGQLVPDRVEILLVSIASRCFKKSMSEESLRKLFDAAVVRAWKCESKREK